MLAKAIIAFVALPGVVGFLLPLGWAVLAGLPLRSPSAFVLVAAGTTLLLWCVREFYVAGKGTLAPWQPPRRLVVSGPYRVSRNPMYVAVVLVLLGWAGAYRSGGLARMQPRSRSPSSCEWCWPRSHGWRARTARPGAAMPSVCGAGSERPRPRASAEEIYEA